MLFRFQKQNQLHEMFCAKSSAACWTVQPDAVEWTLNSTVRNRYTKSVCDAVDCLNKRSKSFISMTSIKGRLTVVYSYHLFEHPKTRNDARTIPVAGNIDRRKIVGVEYFLIWDAFPIPYRFHASPPFNSRTPSCNSSVITVHSIPSPPFCISEVV